MRLLTKTMIHPSRTDSYLLYPLADLHLGARACDEDLLDTYVCQIRDTPHALWVGLGDLIDAILRKGDRRHFESLYSSDLWGKDDIIQHQIDRLMEHLRPIADKCLGLVCGNHEKAVLRHYDNNAYEKIVRDIAAAGGHDQNDLRLGTSGILTLKFKRGKPTDASHPTQTFTVYCHHGYGGGRLKGGKALNLERKMLHVQTDVVLMGHVHDLLFTPKTLILADGTLRHCFGAFLPSFLRSYELGHDSYAEDAGYFPSVVGTFPIEFVPKTRQVIFHIST